MTSSQFIDVARTAIADLCAARPDYATFLGEHSHDSQLEDPTQASARRRQAQLSELVTGLDALGTELASDSDTADRGILRTAAEQEWFNLAVVEEDSWNPMVHNPGQALYGLLSRDFAPIEERLGSVCGRLAAVPDFLAGARQRLDDQSAIHVETAIVQFDGLIALLDNAIPAAAAGSSIDLSKELSGARAAAGEHQDWLRSALPDADRDPRLGAEKFTRKLSLTLATAWAPKALRDQAYHDLERVESELAELVSRRRGGERATRDLIAAEFDRLAEDVPTSETILQTCRDALGEATTFVTEQNLLTLQHDPVEIIEMPEIDRGIAVAYCRGVGALETAPLLTQFAVSPTPADWTAERIRSFYREYNNHMLHNLTVHEAMPGHVEQLSHSRHYQGRTKIRSVFGSGSFIEGWAVYAEELMANHGYRSAVSDDAAVAVRMQRLKMQLRMLLNTVLDISFHLGDLDEHSAMELMTVRGYQEDGEAAGKWRRVQLTSTQLCTYYVGYLELRRLVADLQTAHPDWSIRRVHDTVLSLGSPPVRYLRTLLGLGPTG